MEREEGLRLCTEIAGIGKRQKEKKKEKKNLPLINIRLKRKVILWKNSVFLHPPQHRSWRQMQAHGNQQ